jgi:hypothetical protein
VSISGSAVRLEGDVQEPHMIQAEDRARALELVADHPLLALDDYRIQIFEVPRK